MKDALDVALCSLDISWNNPQKNFRTIADYTENLHVDILVLPEMFSTGFTVNPSEMSEPVNGPSVLFMQQLASERDIVVCGSIPTVENDKYYNRFYWVEPNGSIKTYNKRHLFSFDKEDEVYTAGEAKLIFDYEGWRIHPLVCYDLRFPVWSRNTENSDLYIYVAHWPDVREDAWRTLLKARAIENLAYVVGVNRSGTDNKGQNFSGFSTIFDPVGKQLEFYDFNSIVRVFSINKIELQTLRSRFPFLDDRDTFTIS